MCFAFRYPDLVLGLDEDNEALQAQISGLWNASYAFGWAFGPLLGTFSLFFCGGEGRISESISNGCQFVNKQICNISRKLGEEEASKHFHFSRDYCFL